MPNSTETSNISPLSIDKEQLMEEIRNYEKTQLKSQEDLVKLSEAQNDPSFLDHFPSLESSIETIKKAAAQAPIMALSLASTLMMQVAEAQNPNTRYPTRAPTLNPTLHPTQWPSYTDPYAKEDKEDNNEKEGLGVGPTIAIVAAGLAVAACVGIAIYQSCKSNVEEEEERPAPAPAARNDGDKKGVQLQTTEQRMAAITGRV